MPFGRGEPPPVFGDKPGTPLSLAVGTSGTLGNRFSDATASAFTLPDSTKAAADAPAGEIELNVVGDQRLHRRRRAAIRHMHEFDAGQLLQPLDRQMRRRAEHSAMHS